MIRCNGAKLYTTVGLTFGVAGRTELSMASTPQKSVRDDRVGYVLDALANPDRRHLLETLSDISEDGISVDALLRRATGDSGSGIDERFATAARYVHLPMLADLGVIDYHPSEERVAHRRARVVDVLVTAARAFGGDEAEVGGR